MPAERLVDLLTEIRDQQKRQIDNFERAVASQTEFVELQRKGRPMFRFLVYAPWAMLAFMLIYMAAAAKLL